MRGQDATLERLRVDRQLEEALAHGPDPLHLAEVFGLDEKTAIRYADSARALLEQAAEVGPVGAPRKSENLQGPSRSLLDLRGSTTGQGLASRRPCDPG